MDIASESNVDRLRQVALLLEAENSHLHRRLKELADELAETRGEDGSAQLALELKHLQEQLAARNRKLFGSSSERRPTGDDGDTPSPRERKPQKGHGPRQQNIPVVEQLHDLDEADQVCPQCGGELEEWENQFEESDEIDVVQREFRIVRHKRKKYRCRCGACVETAEGPAKLIPGGRYSPEFAVSVAIGKYGDHLPLERQVGVMRREGLVIDSQTLWDQLWALFKHLKPTYEALAEHVRSRPVIGADETYWRLMGKKKSRRWWVWTLACEDAVYYHLLPSRGHEAAGEVLADYAGTIMADGYSAYRKLRQVRSDQRDRDGPDVFRLAACWAHVRRKFVEAEPNYPVATEAIERIRDLYQVEAKSREADVEDRLGLRAELRDAESRPIVQEFRQWLNSHRVLPKSALGKAITYADGVWPGLELFLEDPRIPLDNNHTERGIRRVVVGRKNHYGSRSERGTQVAALFYSLIESAQLNGLDPAEYLAEATRRAIEEPGTVTLPTPLAGPAATGF